jgi:hypothetical protein
VYVSLYTSCNNVDFPSYFIMLSRNTFIRVYIFFCGCFYFKQKDRDGEFLAKQGIMDYSLLIGVHNERRSLSPDPTSGGLNVSCLQSSMGRRDATHIEGPTVYYLGVVDILQVLSAITLSLFLSSICVCFNAFKTPIFWNIYI